MTPQEKKVIELALEALEKIATVNAMDYEYQRWAKEHLVTIKETLARGEQEPVVGEQAPENSLPTWSECNLIIENDEFRKRAEAGLEGQVLDTPRTTPEPTALHYFIHEYDDSDPYRSAWFLHRLECVLKEVTTPPQRERVLFPTMLRKMWSGSEVQAWLDENVNKEKNT